VKPWHHGWPIYCTVALLGGSPLLGLRALVFWLCVVWMVSAALRLRREARA
jgi:hypothetical protein